MYLKINGEDHHDLPNGMTVGALLDHLDRLEIIHFIGGG